MIETKGSRELITKMRSDLENAKRGITKAHRELVTKMFTDLVKHTPQWSGELVMHWGIEFHGMAAPASSTAFNIPQKKIMGRSIPGYPNDPYKRGDNPAVRMVLARELPKLANLRYNSKVKFVNNMPYAEEVEAGKGPNGYDIREANLWYGKVAMVAYLDNKYSKLSTAMKAIKL